MTPEMKREGPPRSGAIAPRWARRLSDWHEQRPRRLAALVVLLTLGTLFPLLHARFSGDLTDLLPTDSPSARAFRLFREAFGQSDSLIVVALRNDESAGAAEPSPEAWIAALRVRLAGRPGIRQLGGGPREALEPFLTAVLPSAGVAYLRPDEAQRLHDALSEEAIGRALARDVVLLEQSPGLDATQLVQRDPLRLRELFGERVAAFSRGASAGGALALLEIRGERPAQDLAASRALVATVEAAIAEQGVPANLRLLKTGGYAIAVEDERRIRGDLTASTGSSIVFVLLLFLVGFRGLWPLVYAALPLLVGVVWGYGAFLALRGGITMITAVGAAVLVGLGDFGVHLYSELQHARRAGLDRASARRFMVEQTAPRVAVAAFTSAGCFFAFGFTGFRGLADLGLLAGLGLLACLAAFLLLFPLLIARHDPPRGKAPLAYVTEALVAGPLRWPRVAIGLVAALSLAAAVVLIVRGPPPFVADARLLHASHSPALDALAELDARVERPLVPWVVLAEGADDDELAARFERLEAALEPLVTEGVLVDFALPTSALPTVAAQRAAFRALADRDGETVVTAFHRQADAHGFDPAVFAGLENGLRQNLARVKQARLVTNCELHALGASGFVDSFFRADGGGDAGRGRLAAGYLFPRGALLPGPEQAATLTRIEQALATASAAGTGGFSLTGFPVVAAELSARVRADFRGVTGIAALIVVLLVLASSRSLRVTALALLPVALAFLWLLALMRLRGTTFNLMNVVLLPMLVGSGIETGVHLVFGTRGKRDVAAALRPIFLPMFLSALTNVAGFGSLATVGQPAIASMGELAAAGQVFSLIATLLLLPPLLARHAARSPDQSPK